MGRLSEGTSECHWLPPNIGSRPAHFGAYGPRDVYALSGLAQGYLLMWPICDVSGRLAAAR